MALEIAAIIGREITMSALREWAAALGGEAHKAVAVNNLGKWKTATQAGPLIGKLTGVAVLETVCGNQVQHIQPT
jgi:phosphatidylglycerophosphate synthase